MKWIVISTMKAACKKAFPAAAGLPDLLCTTNCNIGLRNKSRGNK